MNKPVKLTLFITFAAAAVFSVVSVASAHDFGYVQDGGGVVHTGSNLCVRTGYWTPALAIVECDPDLVSKAAEPIKQAEAPKPAPVMAKPAPKMAPQKIVLEADALFDTNKSLMRLFLPW